VVELSEHEFPLVVGDAAFVCDPEVGSIRGFDLDTGEPGEILATGYDCSPRRRRGDTLVLRNWDEDAYGLLRPGGVELLDYPLEAIEYDSNSFPHASYLSRWGWSSTLGEDRQTRVISWVGFKLIDIETAEVFEVPENVVAGFGHEDGEDILLVLEPNEAGETTSLVLDTLGEEAQPGPTFSGPVQFFFSHGFGGGVVTETSIYLAEEGMSLPLPGPVPNGGDVVRLDETRFASVFREDDGAMQLAVWNTVSGEGWRAIDLPSGRGCGGIVFNDLDASFDVKFSDDADCLNEALWSIPFDGSEPWLVAEHGPNSTVGRFGLDDAWVFRAPVGRESGDLEVLDVHADMFATLARDIDGLAMAPTSALPRTHVREGDAVEYYVRRGEKAGLWISGLPIGE
jgi:hypothetical protein